MLILSINLNHDGAVVVLRDGALAGYVNTERFSGVKKHPGARRADLDEALAQAGATLAEVDHVILCNHGINYPEIVERYGRDFQDGWPAMAIEPGGRRVAIDGVALPCTVNPDHFLCHVAAAFYFSPFEEAACFACDPLGSGAAIGRANTLVRIPLEESHAGTAYHVVSAEHLRFGGLFGAGKTMGLAPYGQLDDKLLLAEVRQRCRGGLPREAVPGLLDLIRDASARRPAPVEHAGTTWNATAAFLVQEALERAFDACLERLFRAARAAGLGATSASNLCLAGGTALNSVANQVCFARSRFDALYLHPACGDDGTAIGAALYHWHHVLGNPRVPRTSRQAMYGLRTYGPAEVDAAMARHAGALQVERVPDAPAAAAEALARGEILGWFQGASEIGPRALGHRSILANPAVPGMKDTLNARVKFREAFRPFAPSVLAEAAEAWFGLAESPFMLRVARVLKPGAPAITHVDGTARLQTVSAADDPAYHALLGAFEARTGLPLVLNTSFNVRGDPIVETPEDAVRCFLGTNLDALVFPGAVVRKRPAAA